MKYNTIGTSSLASEGKKSTLTIYGGIDDKKMADQNAEIASVRGELKIVQKALKLQTKRCRQLVAEYTKRLQQKEQQYHCEKALREDQLAKVLRALLIFEARLRQEQKFISHQLDEKDSIIRKQHNHIKKLMTSQYCKNCNQYYSPSPNLESLDSSSEYVATDYHDYQSSNFESLDSSSEIYATVSEKSYNTGKSFDISYSGDDISKTESDSTKNIYQKNKAKDSIGRRNKKFPHRKSVGTYFEVLKLRNDSPCSNEDNTSNDYDNLDSLPPENLTDKISVVSERIEHIFQENQQNLDDSTNSSNLTSDCHTTVINKEDEYDIVNITNTSLPNDTTNQEIENYISENDESKNIKTTESKLSDAIAVFDGDGESNDKWYASASDQEDEEQRDVYRNNPVLECVNQILLQNMNDNLNSPPKTPATERKSVRSKRVKFSDEKDSKSNENNALTQENVREKNLETQGEDYYEIPIQKTPNFYETPQSIYSNDYEQILSKCNESFATPNKSENKQEKEINSMSFRKLSVPKNTFEASDKPNHYYIDMDTKSEKDEPETKIIRKSKILRTPPALPPKPTNLVSKYKITTLPGLLSREKSVEHLESEPDYCSISELNLPTNKSVIAKKINVIAEINPLNSNDVKSKLEKVTTQLVDKNPDYDPIIVTECAPNLVTKKCIEKLNIQLAKQTHIKSGIQPSTIQGNKNKEPEIPKLPQVSEIIIPEEKEEPREEKKEERISFDNYVQNNSQILKLKTNQDNRKGIKMGSSVSSLISGFNNRQIVNELIRKSDTKLNKSMLSSFENIQNLDKHSSPLSENTNESQNFDNFDLSQNFEEFKLDDCEIEEYNVDMCDITEEEIRNDIKIVEEKLATVDKIATKKNNKVEMVSATNDVTIPGLNKNSIELLKKQLQLQKNSSSHDQLFQEISPKKINEPTYEHFLECTGLSSKSILTPSRLISNHKNMLKPKDVKLRSRVKANNLIERQCLSGVSTTKYWTEPFI